MTTRRPILLSASPVALVVLLAAGAVAAEPPAPQPSSPPPAQPSATAGSVPAAARPARVIALAEFLRAARERQPQFMQARAVAEAAGARADEARAPLLPQLYASASYQRGTENFVARPGALPSTTRVATGTSWASANYWTSGVTLSQLLWDFGQTSGRWAAARATAQSQRSSERATLAQILQNVRTGYFAARAGRDLVGVSRENLANQEAHLRQIEGFVRIGTRPEVDLAQARTDHANAEVQLIQQENTYETAKAQLNLASGIEGSTDYEVSDEVLAPIDVEDRLIEPLLAEATRNRPDLAALEEARRAQELLVRSVRGAYGPSFGVSLGVTDAGPAFDSTVWNWSATATVSWNIFQGGLTRAQEREARANLASAEAQRLSLSQQIRLDLEQARLSVRASKASLGAAAEALVNGRERLRLAEGRYQAGVGSAIELGDAQVALTAAAAQRVQAEYNLSTSRAQLLRALGRDLPES